MKALSSASGISTETIRFLGLTLQPRSLQQMTMLVEEGIRERRNWIIANHNLHSVYLCHRYPKLRDFYSQVSWTHCDGMSLVALGRLYGYPLQREHRVTLADWIYPLMELAASSGWRVFHLGSSNSAAEKGAAQLRKLYPALQIEVSGGYFDASYDSSENEAIVDRINAYEPDLLMVGMGMPRQEFWTQENSARLNAPVILSSVGAAFDYLSGAVPTPPRWAGPLGLEWLFRLAHDPSRLFTRYLIEPWYVLLLLLLDYPRRRGAASLQPEINNEKPNRGRSMLRRLS
jgi:N-acetylglucosaminyldiphosphoundecaprenol N-acetyl-beta-D-mannosaminyltransferase